MDIASLMLPPQQALDVRRQVEAFNKAMGARGGQLGREDFLKILITQLTHQDPTQPMEDKDFVAQLAQFSTLEQAIRMGDDMGRVSAMLARTEALSLLGRIVTLSDGDQKVSGRVEQVQGWEAPQILVNGKFYDAASVESVGLQ